MKKKLIASAVSLAMALVMLTSASFAWFTVSTAPEITGINVKMEATKNLEIAKPVDGTTLPAEVAAGQKNDEKYYGSTVTFTGTGQQTVKLPATMSGTTVQTMTYDATSKRADALAAATAPTITNGVGCYTYDSKNCAVVYAAWLRSNVDNSAVKTEITGTLADKCKMVVTTTPFTGTAGAAGTAGTETACTDPKTTGFALTANKPTLVKVIFYVDGTQANAADVASGIDFGVTGIKFTSADVA